MATCPDTRGRRSFQEHYSITIPIYFLFILDILSLGETGRNLSLLILQTVLSFFLAP